METYISILRGINVSGHKKIEMAGLKALYEALNFKDVVTYIQSGNVIFKAGDKAANIQLSEKIGKAIFEEFNFEVPVIIRTRFEIEKIISANPFLQQSDIHVEKLHITFLSEVPEEERSKKIVSLNYPPDKFIIQNKEVYLYVPGSYGNTRLSNNFFESKLKVSATTRNWKTVNKLLELAA